MNASHLTPGILAPGELNSITDVRGVRVGHVSVRRGTRFNTGVTVIIPADGNLYRDKLAGLSQVQELGAIETPTALTNTFSRLSQRPPRDTAARSRHCRSMR